MNPILGWLWGQLWWAFTACTMTVVATFTFKFLVWMGWV